MKIVSLEKEFGALFIRHGNEYKKTGISSKTRVSVTMPDDEADYWHTFDSANAVTDTVNASALFDGFNIIKVAANKIPGGAKAQTNQSAITVTKINDNEYTISGNFDEMEKYTSTDAQQAKLGNVRWIGLLLSTGESDLTVVSYNGYKLTADDAAEASGVGGTTGDILLWTYMELGMVRFTLGKGSEATIIQLNLVNSAE